MRSSALAAASDLAALPPSSFAFVMATGIVALAARQQGYGRPALGLFALAGLGWCALWLLSLLRLARHAGRVWADVRDHLRGPGYFTTVAGTAVLASGFLALQVDAATGLLLGAFALLLWLLVTYGLLAALIFYRWLFLRFAPADLTPPSWINMGAMAISTLAGAQLVANAPHAPFLQALLPFVQGFTVLYWATATWWLPLLLALVGWRYLWRRDPARSALDWSAVFPLGMYSAATHQAAAVLGLGFLEALATLFFWLALLAWTATAVVRLRP